MLQAFQQEQPKCRLFSDVVSTSASQSSFGSPVSVDLVNDDLTKEKTDAIVNIVGTDMNMNNFGQLSAAIARASGPKVQQECSQMGTRFSSDDKRR